MVLRQRLNALADSEVEIPLAAVLESGIDYRGQVVIEQRSDEQRDLLFTGSAVSARLAGETVRLTLNPAPEMSELLIGGFSAHRVHPLEIAWSIARTAGFAEERIRFEGFEVGPTEVFEVITPVDGIELDQTRHDVGALKLIRAESAVSLVNTLPASEIRSLYASATTFALALVSARSLIDAEARGLAEIDFFLAWLEARAHYSHAYDPGRVARGYDRRHTLMRPARRDAVLVRGLSTRRVWLRSPSLVATRPPLKPSEVPGLDLLPPSKASVQIREAFAAWRRGADAQDPIARVTALWEAIEFYAAGFTARGLFTGTEYRLLRVRASEGLSIEQVRRLDEVLPQLNDASLRHRLEVAIEADNVPVTPDELEVLSRIRRVRNNFVHGRSRELPVAIDLEYSTALVNRLLTFRLFRLRLGRPAR